MKFFGEQERCPGRSSCPGRGPFLTPPGQSCWTPWGSLGQCGEPQAPLPTGLYLRAGAAGLEGITRLSRGEVCPSSGAGTPPPSPGWGESTKRLCSCPGTNGLKAVGIVCQLATPETPRVRQREGGQVKGRTDRWMKPMQRSLALAGPAPVPAGGCGTGGSTGLGLGTSSHLHRASPRDVPVSLGNAHTALWLQQLVLAPSQCHRALEPAPWGIYRAGVSVLALCAGMGGWQSRSRSRFPGWKKPLQGAGRGCCRIQAASVHPHS